MRKEGPNMVRPGRVLLTKEVAFRLGVSEVTVRVWERQGKLSAQRASGGVRLFDADEIDRLAREREAQRKPEER